ncbi:MAG: hypothetical protein ACK5PF_11560 [bacterium]
MTAPLGFSTLRVARVRLRNAETVESFAVSPRSWHHMSAKSWDVSGSDASRTAWGMKRAEWPWGALLRAA